MSCEVRSGDRDQVFGKIESGDMTQARRQPTGDQAISAADIQNGGVARKAEQREDPCGKGVDFVRRRRHLPTCSSDLS